MKIILLITMTVLTISSCYKEDDYLLSKLDDSFVKIYSTNTNLYADGASSTEVVFEIPYKSKKEFNKVIFKTSKGKFENDKQEIEVTVSKVVTNGQDKKIAKVKLIASQKIEQATVEVKIDEITKSMDFQFIKAFPESIKTDLPSLVITYGNQTINLTTKLTREIGKPSLLTTAKVFAVDPLGRSIGQFLNYTEAVNENGILTNQFSLGTANCNCQNILIISETSNSGTSVMRDTTYLIIN